MMRRMAEEEMKNRIAFSCTRQENMLAFFDEPMKKRVIMKIGTSLITLPDGRLNLVFLSQITEELSYLHGDKFQICIVSSGAVAAGRHIIHRSSHTLIDRQALSCIGQPVLMNYYRDFFLVHDKYVGQGLFTSRDFVNPEGRNTMKKVLESMLDSGVIPIINENDATSSEEFTFGDNDQLASYLAVLLRADYFIILSDVAGLYDKNPYDFPDAKIIPDIPKIDEAVEKLAGRKVFQNSMGGMKSKIKAFQRVTEAGIPGYLLYGRGSGLTTDVLLRGKNGGTFFHPAEKRKK